MGHHLEARDLEAYNVLYLTITQWLHGNFCWPLAFLRSFRMSHETSDSPFRQLRMAESIGKKLSPLTPVTAAGSRASLGSTEEPLIPTDDSLNTQAALGPWSPFSVSLQATACSTLGGKAVHRARSSTQLVGTPILLDCCSMQALPEVSQVPSLSEPRAI